ncbi:hypothetical protein BJ165DRAFT_1533568 [Panaeolus papilionaceus]|nr:hypothetical protein BJ165DRAFT_1533568 [Panaeolus papilionaceus]
MRSGVGLEDILDVVGVHVARICLVVDRICRVIWYTAELAWAKPLEAAGDTHVSKSDLSRIAESLSCINDAVAFLK